MAKQIRKARSAWRSFAKINFENLIFVLDRNASDWKMIENPPNEIKEQIREKESGVLMKESIFTPLVISTMPDITPCESAILSGFEENMMLVAFEKMPDIFVWLNMSIKTKKNEI